MAIGAVSGIGGGLGEVGEMYRHGAAPVDHDRDRDRVPGRTFGQDYFALPLYQSVPYYPAPYYPAPYPAYGWGYQRRHAVTEGLGASFGAVGGALAGFGIGGPVGAVIGGIAGLLLGFGIGKATRRAW